MKILKIFHILNLSSGIQLPKLLADGSLDFSGGAAGALDLWENNNLDRLFKCELCDKAFTQGKGFKWVIFGIFGDFSYRKIKIFMTA